MRKHRDVQSLTSIIKAIGNPFNDNTGDELHVLDSRDIASSDVVNTVRQIEMFGKEQYEIFNLSLNDLLEKESHCQ